MRTVLPSTKGATALSYSRSSWWENHRPEPGVDRDRSTGKSSEELTAMWQEWQLDEDAYIQRDQPQEYANLVIDGTKLLDEQLDIR